MYDDDYPTCLETYATLRLYPGDLDPAEVTERLGVEPTSWQRRGEVIAREGRPAKRATLSGWFLTSRGRVQSRDSRRHVDWILEHVVAKATALRNLQRAGCRMDVFCYWLSRNGHGGPTVSPSQMRQLAELDIELGFDIYGPHEEDDHA